MPTDAPLGRVRRWRRWGQLRLLPGLGRRGVLRGVGRSVGVADHDLKLSGGDHIEVVRLRGPWRFKTQTCK